MIAIIQLCHRELYSVSTHRDGCHSGEKYDTDRQEKSERVHRVGTADGFLR